MLFVFRIELSHMDGNKSLILKQCQESKIMFTCLWTDNYVVKLNSCLVSEDEDFPFTIPNKLW